MEFTDPHGNIMQAGFPVGGSVADIGAGSGHYIVSLSRAVGENGKVFAVDVQRDMLKKVEELAKENGLSNVQTVWGDADRQGGLRLPDKSMDGVIVSNTLFQIEDKEKFMAEIGRIAKSGARALIVDWAGSYGGLGPDENQVFSEREAEDMFIKHGWHKQKAFAAGPHHYGLVFKAP